MKLVVGRDRTGGLGYPRVRVDFVKEAPSVVFVKNAGEAPRLLLERLHVLNFHYKDISRLGAFHLKGTREVVNLGEVNVLHIVGAIVVANLPSCPVYALYLEDFSIFNFSCEGDCERSQWQIGRMAEGVSCRLDAICSDKGQGMLDEYLGWRS